jgi:RNA polymerase sigma-70 factor (ECF subfamily)
MPPTLRVVAPVVEGELDTADVGVIFRRFSAYVAHIGVRLLGPGADVDDLVQDVFLDAHRGLAALRDRGAVRHWLATVTVRKARRRLRRRALARLIGLEAPSPAALERARDHAASAETGAYLVAIDRILDSVSADARIAWIMHRVEGEALEAVAVMCGCSRATAHRRVQEAQAALEKGLADVTP